MMHLSLVSQPLIITRSLTLRSLCSSAPQDSWTQCLGHRVCSILGGPSNTTVSYTLHLSASWICGVITISQGDSMRGSSKFALNYVINHRRKNRMFPTLLSGWSFLRWTVSMKETWSCDTTISRKSDTHVKLFYFEYKFVS